MPFLAGLFGGRPGPAERDTLVEGAIIADLRGLADHHANAVVDEQAVADLCPGVDVDRRQDAAEMRDKAAGKMPAALPQPVPDPMEQQYLEPRIAQHHLEA